MKRCYTCNSDEFVAVIANSDYQNLALFNCRQCEIIFGGHAVAIPIELLSMIDRKVCKKSCKPFKSGNKINTVSGIINHPQRQGKLAFVFYEDESHVSAEICLEVKEDEEAKSQD